MTKPSTMQYPLLEPGLVSMILGAVGLFLAFLPVLGIPLGGLGLLFGCCGLVLALAGGGTSLRLSVLGIVLSGCALGVGLTIVLAPADWLPRHGLPPITQPESKSPYIPPPARPTSAFSFSGHRIAIAQDRESRERGLAPSQRQTIPARRLAVTVSVRLPGHCLSDRQWINGLACRPPLRALSARPA